MQNGSARLDKVVPKADARRETSGPGASFMPGAGFVATTAAEAGGEPLARPPFRRLPRSARLGLALHIPLIFTSTFASLRGPPGATHTPVKAKSEFERFKAGCPLWEAAARGPLFAPPAPPPSLSSPVGRVPRRGRPSPRAVRAAPHVRARAAAGSGQR